MESKRNATDGGRTAVMTAQPAAKTEATEDTALVVMARSAPRSHQAGVSQPPAGSCVSSMVWMSRSARHASMHALQTFSQIAQ